MFEGIKVFHKTWGQGEILEVINNSIKLKFEDAVRNMQVSSCLKFLDVDDSNFIEYAKKQKRIEDENQRFEEERLNKQREEWLKKHNVNKKLSQYGYYDDNNPFLGRRARDIEMSESELYKIIGYLANPRHVRSFVAEIPSGYEYKKRLEEKFPDSNFIDVGDGKQGCQFRIFLIPNSNMPSVLKQNVAKNYGLSYSRFAYKLVDKHGFRFSNVQDIDRIKSKIPNDYLEIFEEGFNL